MEKKCIVKIRMDKMLNRWRFYVYKRLLIAIWPEETENIC